MPSNLQGGEKEYDWSWDLKKQICVSINIVSRTRERCQTEKPAPMFVAASTPKIKPRRACWKIVKEIHRALQIDKVFIFRSVSVGWTTSNNTRILHWTFLQWDKLLVSPAMQDHKRCILLYLTLSFHGISFVRDEVSLGGSWPFSDMLLLPLPISIGIHPHV